MATPDIVDALDLGACDKQDLEKLLEELVKYEKEVCEACERTRKQIQKIRGLLDSK